MAEETIPGRRGQRLVTCSVEPVRTKKVKDADLAHLSGLPRVKTVFLSTTAITDEGLQHLKGLTDLKKLYLADTKVTDKGMANLEGLSLDTLILANTSVSEAKLAELQKKFGPTATVMK